MEEENRLGVSLIENLPISQHSCRLFLTSVGGHYNLLTLADKLRILSAVSINRFDGRQIYFVSLIRVYLPFFDLLSMVFKVIIPLNYEGNSFFRRHYLL